MRRGDYLDVGAREREAMDVLFRYGEVSVAELQRRLPVRLSGSALRTMLSRLEAKGLVSRRSDSGRNLYAPTVKPAAVRTRTLRRIVRTFFGGSALDTVAALLDDASMQITDEELDRAAGLIAARRARRDGTKP